MTRPILAPEKIPTTLRGEPPLVDVPLEVEGEELEVTAVSLGNPHCVIFVEDPDTFPVERIGPRVARHPAFPEGANVEFARVVQPGELRQRTWERGVGETLACGSGACAVCVAGVLSERSSREVTIHLRGGDLELRWPTDDGPVWLAGPAAHVFDAEVDYP
jgi:diaminopimelate epimerase